MKKFLVLISLSLFVLSGCANQLNHSTYPECLHKNLCFENELFYHFGEKF